MSNDLILGAVGVLQFDVVAYRLKDEYGVRRRWRSPDRRGQACLRAASCSRNGASQSGSGWSAS
jgi:peptide subunit release factor RF-3